MSRRFDHKSGVASLALAINAYARAGVTAWMQDGTLLGAVRSGRPIPWDYDMDIGLMHRDWAPEADERMLEAGFKSEGNHNSPESDYHQKWIRAGVKFCVFHYYTDPDGRVWHGLRQKRYRYYYPEEFEVRPLPILGVPIPAPYPPEAFLARKYGPDWRRPKARWDSSSMPSNAVRVK